MSLSTLRGSWAMRDRLKTYQAGFHQAMLERAEDRGFAAWVVGDDGDPGRAPKLRIDPKIVVVEAGDLGQVDQALLGNSITLTPGTITVYVSIFGKFSVHAIDEASRQGLTGEMEDKVAAIFGE